MAKQNVGRAPATAKHKRIRLWLAAPIAAAVVFFVPVPARLVDRWYSQGLYPVIERWVTFGTNRVPWAVLDGMIVVATLLVLYRVVRLGALALAGQPRRASVEGLQRLVRAAGVILLWFVVVWGLNYRRLPIEATLGPTPPAPIDVAALRSAVVSANALAARIRPKETTADGPMYGDLARDLSGPINEALASLGRVPLGRSGVPKSSILLTPFFTAAGVNGMINPLALESIVHPELTPAERGFVLAHEWAHLAGYADEAEASAVGWLACLKGSPELAYSGSLYLIMEAGSALPGGEWRRLAGGLDAGVRADLTRVNERLQAENPRVRRAATRVYDEYLKANRVPDGARSYGRALTLILREPFASALVAASPSTQERFTGRSTRKP